METKEIITTLKAEPVNEAIIEKRNVGTKHEAWPYELTCKIATKVGNVVKNVTVCIDKNFDSDAGKYRKTFKVNDHAFDDLLAAGIEIDFSKIKTAYAFAVKKALYAKEKEKKEAEEKRIKKRKEFYKNSWYQSFVDEVDNDKRNEMKDFTFGQVPKKQYINSTGLYYATITYKGLTGLFYRKDVNGELKFTVENAQESYKNDKGEKCTRTVYVTNSKMRHGKLAKSVVHRWFQDVDEYFAVQESRKRRKENEEKARLEHIKFLSEASGEQAYAKHEFVPRRRDFGGDYYQWRYFIKLKPIGEEKEKEYRIDYNSHYEYFSINGLNLDKNQFKAVIDILKKKNI